VILADIDHFKSVNDRYGHGAGDEVLRAVAERLRTGLRVYDSVGRYGGEEFLLILPGCDTEQIIRRADELRRAVSALPAAPELYVTISLGAGSTDTLRGDPDCLLNSADDALYRAKELGRNRVHPATVFRPGPAFSTTEARCFL
jgi:diguanylate cyclase (GGDEF)-like protein